MVYFSGLYVSGIDIETINSEFKEVMEDERLFNYLANSGGKFCDESVAIEAAARSLLSQSRPVSNKNLIYSLLNMLSCSDDVVTSDIVRHAIEIVIEFTEDDL